MIEIVIHSLYFSCILFAQFQLSRNFMKDFRDVKNVILLEPLNLSSYDDMGVAAGSGGNSGCDLILPL